MDKYVQDIQQIAQKGELAIIVGSKPANPWELLREEIFKFLNSMEARWQGYVREIRERNIPSEVFFRLLYQQLGNNFFSILQGILQQRPNNLHRQLAALIQHKLVSCLGICSIDTNLRIALQEAGLQENRDYYLRPSPVGQSGNPLITLFQGDAADIQTVQNSLNISDNRMSALTSQAQRFFREISKAKALLVLEMGRDEFCWKNIYGQIVNLAKRDKPVYWATQENFLSLQHLMAISKGGLIPQSSNDVCNALLGKEVVGAETIQLDFSHIAPGLAKIPAMKWLYFIGSLLKYSTSHSHSYNLFETLAGSSQDAKKYDTTASCYRNMGEILTAQGCIEKAIKAHTVAIEYWSTIKDENSLAQESILVGDNYCNGSSFDKAVQYYGEGLSLYRYHNNLQGILDVTSKLATLCEEDGDYELAKRYYLESLQAVRGLKNFATEVRTLLHLAATLMKEKEWARTLQYLEEALALCEKEEDTYFTSEIYQQLGLVAMNQQDYQMAREHYEKAYALYKESGEELALTFVYCNLGHVCARLSDYDMAVQHYENALESYEKMGDWQHLAAVYNNLGLINSNRENYNMAEEYFSKAAEIFAALQDVYNLIRAYNNLARVYTLQEELENAAECYRANIEMLLQLGEQEDLASTLVALAMIQLKTQQTQGALAHLQQAANLYDVLGMKQEREETIQLIQTIENTITSSS